LKIGQSIILSDDTPVCSSKDNVDKMISYVKNKNTSATQGMMLRGEADILSKGTKINVVKIGTITQIETDSGATWYTIKEMLK
jgi:hypothetical protein